MEFDRGLAYLPHIIHTIIFSSYDVLKGLGYRSRGSGAKFGVLDLQSLWRLRERIFSRLPYFPYILLRVFRVFCFRGQTQRPRHERTDNCGLSRILKREDHVDTRTKKNVHAGVVGLALAIHAECALLSARII